MNAPARLRCAIYTRKSTEEGLDQDFNSLDAQREACAAFIQSQAGLGWKLVPDRFDDPGISGGTMERPALQRLLRDISGKKIDVVVVYKIDRLTRSLTDFAKMVDVFDGASASFVSVTQQFNTTTSMGRLTLNVLLSFAQFEREVTAERIRDKVAASKAKGMWMGGTVPFGYCIVDRKLIVEEPAAAEVRALFDRYLELGSVPALVAELNGDGRPPTLLHSDTAQGRRRVPTRVGAGKIYYMLSNPIYIGKVRHKDRMHQGDHSPIIDDATFRTVQERLASKAPSKRGSKNQSGTYLLRGLLFDDTGDKVSPVYASKAGKRYRYYISRRLMDGAKDDTGWRLPSTEIEAIIVRQLKAVFADKALLATWLNDAGHAARIGEGLGKAGEAAAALDNSFAQKMLHEIVQASIRRIDLASHHIRISVNWRAIACWLVDPPVNAGDREHSDEHLHIIELPLTIKKRGVERRLVIEGQGSASQHDRSLIDTIARAHLYIDMLTKGQSRRDVANRFGVHPEDVSRVLPMAYLSPKLTQLILTGRQPVDLSARDLKRGIDLPIAWADQSKLLSI